MAGLDRCGPRRGGVLSGREHLCPVRLPRSEARQLGTTIVDVAVAVHAALGFFDRRVGTAVRMAGAVALSLFRFSLVSAAVVLTYILLAVPR